MCGEYMGAKTRRSEEHTSELQSPCNLVYRLLLGSEEHTSELQSPCNLVYRLLLGSEEHTSELQSPCNLVCRLLLEKTDTKRHMVRADHIPSKSHHPPLRTVTRFFLTIKAPQVLTPFPARRSPVL